MPFQTPIDVANRALQHITQSKIATFQEDSVAAGAINTAYDDLRLAELSRHTWEFSIKRCRTRAITFSTQLWTPPTWGAGNTYTVGMVTMFAGGTYANSAIYPWICQVPSSLGQSPDISSDWSHFYGVLTTDIFDSGATYAAGEVVIEPLLFDSGATYAKNNIIKDSSGNFWVSLVNGNIGHTPASSPADWVAWVLPSSGNPTTITAISFLSTPLILLNLLNDNGPVNGAPTSLPSTSADWVNVAGTLQQLTVLFPIGSGFASQTSTENLYRLPPTWLRPAPELAKRYGQPWLGALYGPMPKDYTYQGVYFTARASAAFGAYFDIQFVADIADVTVMHPQFCESLAIRIGLEIDEPLTSGKNTDKLERAYKRITGEAMRVDSILQGDRVEDLEEFIRVRF